MWSTIRKSGLLAAAFLAIAAGSARAEVVMDVKVPFPFIVHGQTLPAGMYRIERDGTDVVLIRGEKGNKVGMFAMTMPAAGHDPVGEKPSLTFTRYETQYRLADIWESGSEGREILAKKVE